MKKSEYEALNRRLTELSEANPERFEKQYRRFCLLCYGYPILLISIAIGLMGVGGYLLFQSFDGYPWKLVILLVGVLLFKAILRALWFEIPAPEGLIIDDQTSQKFRTEIEQIRRMTGCPKIHQIYFVLDVNAAIIQQPRLLNLFFPKNYLIIGLPLLYLLSTEQFRTVVTHEMGHIVNHDGASGSFFLRVMHTWERLAGLNAEKRSWRHYLFLPLYRWLAPRMSAWRLVKGRLAEYKADWFSAHYSDPQDIASSLCKVEATVGFLNQEIQDRVRMEMYYHREPPVGLLQRMIKMTTQDLWMRRGPHYVQRAMQERTMPGDTHPALADRLASVGEEPQLNFSNERSAGEYYFGRASAQLVTEIDELWCRGTMLSWRIEHEILREKDKQVNRLRNLIKEHPLPAYRWQLAKLASEIYGPRDSLKYFLEFGRLYPNCAHAQLAIGIMKFRLDADDCLKHFYQAMEGDPMCYLQAALFAYEWSLRVRDRETADVLQSHIEQFYDNANLYAPERLSVSRDDDFSVPSLPENEWVDIIHTCELFEGSISHIVLLEKKADYYDHYPIYVLAIETRLPEEETDQITEQLQNMVHVQGTTITVSQADHPYLRKVSKKLDNPYIAES